MSTLAGVLLFVTEITLVLAAPGRLQAVIDVPGAGATLIVVPWGICLAIGAYALATRRLQAGSPNALWYAIVVGVAVNILLLLGDYSTRLTEPGLFTSRAYWMYARIFCGSSLAAAIAWIGWDRHEARTSGPRRTAFAVPIALATIVYAVMLLRADLAVLLFGGLAGVALAVGMAVRGDAIERALQHVRREDRLFDTAFLTATFVIALALRLAYTSRVMTNPDFLETGGDGPFYDRIATSIAEGHGTGEAVASAYPLLLLGYPRLIALVYLVFGRSYFAVCAVQALLGAATCLIVYAIAQPIFGRTAARIGAAFTAVSFQLIFSASAYGHQAVDPFLTALTAWLLIRAGERRAGWAAWLIIGLLVGIGIAVRETQVFFAAFVLLWLPLVSGSTDRWRKVLASATWLGVGTALVALPLVAPKVASAESRMALRQHLDRLWLNPIATEPGAKPSRVASPFANPDLAAQQVRQDPLRVIVTAARSMAVNFGTQFFTQPYGGFDLVFLTKNSAYYYGLWFWAYVLTGLGCAIAVNQCRRGGPHATAIALILGLLVARTIPHVILESQYHHRAPIEPFLIMLAAVGAARLFGANPAPTPGHLI